MRDTYASKSARCLSGACIWMPRNSLPWSVWAFRQVRDLLRLPRKALTRRFGPTVTAYLDRLLGIQADPRPLYQPPETFVSRMDLPAEITASQALLFPLKRLLEELCGVLRGGDTAAQSLQIVLGHEDHEIPCWNWACSPPPRTLPAW